MKAHTVMVERCCHHGSKSHREQQVILLHELYVRRPGGWLLAGGCKGPHSSLRATYLPRDQESGRFGDTGLGPGVVGAAAAELVFALFSVVSSCHDVF